MRTSELPPRSDSNIPPLAPNRSSDARIDAEPSPPLDALVRLARLLGRQAAAEAFQAAMGAAVAAELSLFKKDPA